MLLLVSTACLTDLSQLWNVALCGETAVKMSWTNIFMPEGLQILKCSVSWVSATCADNKKQHWSQASEGGTRSLIHYLIFLLFLTKRENISVMNTIITHLVALTFTYHSGTMRVMYCRSHKAFQSSLQKFYIIFLFLCIVMTKGYIQDHMCVWNLSY